MGLMGERVVNIHKCTTIGIGWFYFGLLKNSQNVIPPGNGNGRTIECPTRNQATQTVTFARQDTRSLLPWCPAKTHPKTTSTSQLRQLVFFFKFFGSPFKRKGFFKNSGERFSTPVLPTDDDCWLHGFLGL